MTDATAKFFDDLASRGTDPRLHKVMGALRFDLVHNDQVEHWVLAFDRGDVQVSRQNAPENCDCVVRTDKALFEGIARGEANVTAAMLRGALSVDGSLELLLLFQRLLTSASTSHEATKGSVEGSTAR